MSFEPKILGYLCNWCAYSASDQAAGSRLTVPDNLRVVRVMCTGRVDPGLILETLRSGADGVLVFGCRPASCHYVTGNAMANARVLLLRRLLAEQGIDAERVRFASVAATDGEGFVTTIREMTETLRALGPLHATAEAS